MGKLENEYQGDLIKKIEKMFPGCIVIKNNPNYLQGIPDLSVFFRNTWATLEVKRTAGEKPRPNQPWYVETMNNMSFSAFIYPENEVEVLEALARYFGALS